jgi:hypothetical protein
MNRIGPYITATSLSDVAVPSHVGRVLADGGTIVDQQGASRVWEAVSVYGPSLVNFCRAGKASLLYSLVP